MPETQNPFDQTSPSGVAPEGLGPARSEPASRDYEIFDNSEANVLAGNQIYELQQDAYPNFFEQIMMPQPDNAILNMELVIPPDISNFVQDMDFSMDEFDFQLLEPFPTMDFYPGNSTGGAKEGQMLPSPNSTLSLRADAFQLSPWYACH